MKGTKRSGRSFIGSIDGFWNGKSGGNRKKVNAAIGAEELDLGTLEGSKWKSVIGRAFCKYVDVLLEPALSRVRVEDEAKLVAVILSVVLGPEIPAVEIDDDEQLEVAVKVEDESD